MPRNAPAGAPTARCRPRARRSPPPRNEVPGFSPRRRSRPKARLEVGPRESSGLARAGTFAVELGVKNANLNVRPWPHKPARVGKWSRPPLHIPASLAAASRVRWAMPCAKTPPRRRTGSVPGSPPLRLSCRYCTVQTVQSPLSARAPIPARAQPRRLPRRRGEDGSRNHCQVPRILPRG